METYYVNGFFKRRNNAKISVEDRGFNFSDGVYELIAYLDEKLIFFDKHYSRLSKSLFSFKISLPLSNKKILNTKIILVSVLIVVAIISIPIISLPGDDFLSFNLKSFKHALEWDYFIGVILFYLLTFFMWKKN